MTKRKKRKPIPVINKNLCSAVQVECIVQHQWSVSITLPAVSRDASPTLYFESRYFVSSIREGGGASQLTVGRVILSVQE